MKVKVCGITSREDAGLALDAGAWALGLIFYARSPRYQDPEQARRIVEALPPETLTIGVFVDEPIERLNEIVRHVGLRGAQLHGAEDADYAAAVEAGVVIKALRVGPEFHLDALDPFARQRVLLDAHVEGFLGGTGVVFDWEVARRAARRRPIILAGGITPENAAEAARVVGPEALDVSSGLEAAPGRKDPAKVRALFRAIESLDPRAGHGA